MKFNNPIEKFISKEVVPEIKYLGDFGRIAPHKAFIVDGVFWTIRLVKLTDGLYEIEKIKKDNPYLQDFLENKNLPHFRFPEDGEMEPKIEALLKLLPPEIEPS